MEAVKRQEFVEYANVHGNYYGTSFAGVRRVTDAGKVSSFVRTRPFSLFSYSSRSLPTSTSPPKKKKEKKNLLFFLFIFTSFFDMMAFA